MSDISRLSMDIADLPLMPFGMRSPTSRSGTSRIIPGSHKMSRKHLKSPTSGVQGRPTKFNLPPTIQESSKENVVTSPVSKSNSKTNSKKKLPVQKVTTQLKHKFPLRPISNMAPLLEEDTDDAFLVPQIPRRVVPRSLITTPSRVQRGKHPTAQECNPAPSAKNSDTPLRGSVFDGKFQEPFHDRTVMSIIRPIKTNHVLCSTWVDDRRESVMTDIDDGSFVEYTSEIPDGRVIPHNDSVTNLRDNLYFTCNTQQNETEYSTSTKKTNARYGFHKLVDAIKNQKILQQISKDVRQDDESQSTESNAFSAENDAIISGSADVMRLFAPPKAKVLNSTMVGDKHQSQFPLCVPDFSSIALNSKSSVDDSVPLNSNYNSGKQTPVTARTTAHHIPTPTKGPPIGVKPLADSLISEDVSLAVSEKEHVEVMANNVPQYPSNTEPGNAPLVSNNRPTDDVNKGRIDAGHHRVGAVVTVPEGDSGSNTRSNEDRTPSLIEASVLPKSPPTVKLPSKKPISPCITKKYTVGQTATNFRYPNEPLPLQTNKTADQGSVRATTNSTLTAVPSTPSALNPAVCQWLVNSPFHDGSFDDSFLYRVSRESIAGNCGQEISEKDEPSDHGHGHPEKSNKDNNSNNGNDTDSRDAKKRRNVKPSDVNNYFTSEDDASSEQDDESIRLRLCQSSRTTNTVFTIGRVAKSPPMSNHVNIAPTTISKKQAISPSSSTSTASIMSSSKKYQILADSDDSDDVQPGILNTDSGKDTKFKKTSKINLNSIPKQKSLTSEVEAKKVVSTKGIKSKVLKHNLKPKGEFLCASPELRKSKPLPEENLLKLDTKLTAVQTIDPSTTKPNKNIKKNTKLAAVQTIDPSTTKPNKNIKSISSDSDDLTSYMKTWRKKQELIITSDESDDAKEAEHDTFLTDDSGDDDEVYFIPSLAERLLHRSKSRGNTPMTTPARGYNNIPQDTSIKHKVSKPSHIYSLSDSCESLPTLEQTALSKESSSTILLTDSDDDMPYSTPLVTVPITPIASMTPKPTKKKTAVCPKTVGPSKPVGANKVIYKSNSIAYGTPTLSFISSLSVNSGNDRLHPEAVKYTKNFKKNSEDLVKKLFKLFNCEVFSNKLPENMKITWNVRMTKTAGFCYYQLDRSAPSGRSARVELSTKVVDDCQRLRDTLVHELCHAAAWIISGYKDGHGPLWKAWATQSMTAFPELPLISRCHAYQIACKYNYRCTKCGYSIGRHSKSLDTTRKVCGRCRGQFELLVRGKAKGAAPAPATPKTPAPFAVFIKENYSTVKQQAGSLKHGDVMKLLSQKFKQMKT